MTENRKKPEKQKEKENMNINSTTSGVADEGFWKEMWHQLRLVWYLLRSPDVPIYLKLLPLIAVIYIIVPTDLIPDVFPFVGQLDDLTALLVGAKVFIELAPQEVVARHIRSARQQMRATPESVRDGSETDSSIEDSIIIEGEFAVMDEDADDLPA
jgi:uncharacterized membrane protein YkvA (DUF1232 family)